MLKENNYDQYDELCAASVKFSHTISGRHQNPNRILKGFHMDLYKILVRSHQILME